MKKFVFVFLYYPQIVLADSEILMANKELGGVDLTKMFFGLFFIIIFIFVLAYLVKRFNGFGMTKNNFFQIISAVSLGSKDKLILVKAGGRYLLLSVSSQGIQKIHDYGLDLNFEEETNKESEFFDLFKKIKERARFS